MHEAATKVASKKKLTTEKAGSESLGTRQPVRDDPCALFALHPHVSCLPRIDRRRLFNSFLLEIWRLAPGFRS